MTTWLFNISFLAVTSIPCWLHLWLYGLIYPLVQKISDARSPQKDFGCDGNQRAFHLLSLSHLRKEEILETDFTILLCVPQSFGLIWERIVSFPCICWDPTTRIPHSSSCCCSSSSSQKPSSADISETESAIIDPLVSYDLSAQRAWRTLSSRPEGPQPRSRGPEGP